MLSIPVTLFLILYEKLSQKVLEKLMSRLFTAIDSVWRILVSISDQFPTVEETWIHRSTP